MEDERVDSSAGTGQPNTGGLRQGRRWGEGDGGEAAGEYLLFSD